MDEGARDGDHARVRLPSIPHFWHTGLLVHAILPCRLCSDAEFIRSVWQRYDALATDGDTSSASSARVFTLLISALKRLVTSRPILLGVSAQMHGVGIPVGNSQSRLHSHHSWDSVAEMVAVAASATVL